MSRSVSKTQRRGLAWIGIVAAVVVVGALGFGGYALWSRDEVSEPGSSASDLAVAAQRGFEITTTAMGDLAARNQIEIRNELESMSHIEFVIEEGMHAKTGDLLIELNTDELDDRIEEGKGEVTDAKHRVTVAENDHETMLITTANALREGELQVELARLSLQQWREGEDKQRLLDIALNLEKTERDLARLVDKTQRSRELFSQGFLSKNELDLDEIRLKEAEAAFQKAQLDEVTYLEYQRPRDQKSRESDVDSALAELDKIKSQNKTSADRTSNAIANEKDRLKRHSDRLDEMLSQEAKATIHAPSDGLVVYGTSAQPSWRRFDDSGPFQIGRQVRPNELLIILPDTSEMMASVMVHESLAGRIAPGSPATVRIDAMSGAVFAGVVDKIGVLAEDGGWRDPNRREYKVDILIETGPAMDELKPSMRCEAQIELGRIEDALTVPIEAVFNDAAVRFVYVPRGAKYERRPVRLGRKSDSYAEILGGLDEGQPVLVREPNPGEILMNDWVSEDLETLGYRLDDEGKPVGSGSFNANGGGEQRRQRGGGARRSG